MASYKDFDFKKLYFIVYIALILLVVFLLFKLGIFLFPFTLALFISIIIRPLTRFLMNKLKFSRKTASIISIVTFLLIFFGIIGWCSLKLVSEIYKLSQNLNSYSEMIQKLWTDSMAKIYSYLGNSESEKTFIDKEYVSTELLEQIKDKFYQIHWVGNNILVEQMTVPYVDEVKMLKE